MHILVLDGILVLTEILCYKLIQNGTTLYPYSDFYLSSF